ncbi:MAG: hypothetical protein ACLUSP_00275 [Christensenellales bacterium]
MVSHCKVMSGPFVCNVNLDESLVKNDDNFENSGRSARLLPHGRYACQLNYVSAEKLLDAKAHPKTIPI